MSTSSTRGAAGGLTMSGKIYDPVFLCMIGAVALAVGTSVLLRVVSSSAGPSTARAAEFPGDDTPMRSHRPQQGAVAPAGRGE